MKRNLFLYCSGFCTRFCFLLFLTNHRHMSTFGFSSIILYQSVALARSVISYPTRAREIIVRDDVCKSEKPGFPSLSFFKVSPEMEENSDELPDLPLEIESSPTVHIVVKRNPSSGLNTLTCTFEYPSLKNSAVFKTRLTTISFTLN